MVAAGVYLVAAQLAFDAGHVLPVVDPLVALALGAVGTLALHYLIAAFERQRVRDTFARFVPEAVVDEVLERTDADLRLGGVRREGTVLFSDLRGFTTFSETLEPDQVIELLNRYLSEMSDAIMDHGGTLVGLHGGRHHGRVRGADRAGRSRRAGPGGGPRDARRAAAPFQRVDALARAWARAFRWASA